MTDAMTSMLADPVANFVLMCADDKLMLGHMVSDWTGLAPNLEEDIAASSMAQDDLSHALVLYEHLGNRFGLEADEIAFARDAGGYRCCDLMTCPEEFDWATSLVKRWLAATFAACVFDVLCLAQDNDLATRASRLREEQAIHVRHLGAWMIRLGSGTAESRSRMQSALDRLAAEACMLFECPETGCDTDAFPPDLEAMFDAWSEGVRETLKDAGLSAEFSLPPAECRGGRRGTHADHFGEQLKEMTEVRRGAPSSAW
jgi:ring-1,2-phenylacetyl-CoA epoxidase subunit PaaC